MKKPRHPPVDWNVFTAILGTVPDAVIARQLGVHHAAVANARNKQMIPRYCKSGRGDPLRHVDWQKYDALLGKMEDRKLAEKIGCTEKSVYARRARLKIKSFSTRGRRKAVKPT